MVAYIEYTKGMDRTWYVGQNAEILQQDINISNTVSIQADCDELEYILLKFANLPVVTHKRVMTWYGDTAKFIVKHL